VSILACRERTRAYRPIDRVLGLEFFHKLNMIVVCDNLFVMRAKILRQNMQQGVLGLLKVNVELLLLFLVEIFEIKAGLSSARLRL
jgi:hypothetical protein